MPHSDTYKFYEAYVTNVREFLLAESEIRRNINRALKSKKTLTEKVQTKLYALLYSTFSEASFMKMVLTPHGFEQAYVEEILKQESVQQKWIKCIELAFNKFSMYSKNSEIPNKTQALKRIIQKFIVDPSVLRNKIAHGQLTIALNSKNSNLNPETTQKLDELNVVTISRWFEINKRLCSIVEDLIESPNKAHHGYYHSKYQDLENFILKSESWNRETKLQTKSMMRPVVYKEKKRRVI